MKNPTNKLIILFKNGHEEKRNIYDSEYARLSVKNHLQKEDIKNAVWFNAQGKELVLQKAKVEKKQK